MTGLFCIPKQFVEKLKTRNVEARERLAKGPEQQQEKS